MRTASERYALAACNRHAAERRHRHRWRMRLKALNRLRMPDIARHWPDWEWPRMDFRIEPWGDQQ